MTEMSALGGLIYVVYAASAMASGWASDRWMERGASSNLAREVRNGGQQSGDRVGNARLRHRRRHAVSRQPVSRRDRLRLGNNRDLRCGTNTRRPSRRRQMDQRPKRVGNVAGIVAPVITGLVIDRTGEFYWAFVVAGAAAVLGIFMWGVVIRKSRRLPGPKPNDA